MQASPLIGMGSSPKLQFWVPYNGKILDLTHPDTNKHTADLAAPLAETRKIIAVIVQDDRIAGTGELGIYPNEGANFFRCNIWSEGPGLCVIANGTNRIQYSCGVANDDYDLYCFGYVVEA